MSKDNAKPRCEDIGFVHAWEDFELVGNYAGFPLSYPNPLRRCQNCGRVEEYVVIKPQQEEVRAWRVVKPS